MSRRILSEKQLLKVAENFGEMSDEDNLLQFESDVSEDCDDLEVEEDGESSENYTSESEEEAAKAASGDYIAKSGRIWKSKPSGKRGRRSKANILQTKPGPTALSEDLRTAEDIFNLFFNHQVKDIICKYTNQEATKAYQKWNNENPTNKKEWNLIDIVELDAYLGILLTAGALRCGKEEIKEMWTTDESIRRSFFAAAMSRNRFEQMQQFLRFDDKETRITRKENDKLAAIREIFEIIRCQCLLAYEPHEAVTIDEQLVSFRGKCPFRQYIRSKPDRYGIKIWAAADAQTSYIYNFQVYTGKKTGDQAEKKQGFRVVCDLAEPLFGSGRGITTDNFFTSCDLAEFLLQKNLTLLGTVRKNKPDTPPQLSVKSGRDVHSSKFAFAEKLTMVSYIPKKNKMVHLLSTQHTDCQISDDEGHKPTMILDYNQTKGGVDNSDKMISEYRTKRSTRRWPMRLFYQLLDIAALDTWIIFYDRFPEWERQNTNRRKLFLLSLGKQLVHSYMVRRSKNMKLHKNVIGALISCGIKMDSPTTATATTTNAKRGRCVHCNRQEDKKSAIICELCQRFVCDKHRIDTKRSVCKINCLQDC